MIKADDNFNISLLYLSFRLIIFVCPSNYYPLFCLTGSQAFRNAEFGEGSGVIFLEGLECDGTESSLLDCPMDVELGLSICDHSDDAGIRCYGTYVHRYYLLPLMSCVLLYTPFLKHVLILILEI